MNDVVSKILSELPMRAELYDWCLSHPHFFEALKASNTQEFTHFGGISITRPKLDLTSQVLGIIFWDKDKKLLKQDFIVDKGFKHEKFILFTNLPKNKKYLYQLDPQSISSIDQFYNIYGKNGDYKDAHYPELKSLDPKIQLRINNYLLSSISVSK